jgi:hypothetical protein
VEVEGRNPVRRLVAKSSIERNILSCGSAEFAKVRRGLVDAQHFPRNGFSVAEAQVIPQRSGKRH